MLQFSRTLFAMGRDRALPGYFGQVHEKTITPVRTMYMLLIVGLALIVISSFLPSVSAILNDSVAAIAVQVCYYYGLAGLVCAWVYRKSTGFTFVQYVIFPALSAIALIGLGFYAITTFNMIVKVVGIGGLALGILFYRPRGYKLPSIVAAE